MTHTWRLLVDGDASGPWNMGVDDALLVSAVRDLRATLRFYTWRGPWLSVGYAQTVTEARRAACEAAGLGIVRRLTGGRAVLHGGDLTYAIAAPAERLPKGLRASYGLVSDALCRALRALGAPAQRQPAARVGGPSFDCFALPAAEEICAGDRKLVGSAQRRAGGAVLQHGSIRVTPDPEWAARAAGSAPGAATSLRELGVEQSLELLREACTEALHQALGGVLEPGELSDRERRDAAHGARRRERSGGVEKRIFPE
ncbi:MAG TPA: biotin/lipoate A/B protein ligase family protein, partial [Myxococcota bacterium]